MESTSGRSKRQWIGATLLFASRAKDSAGTPLSANGVESLEYTPVFAPTGNPSSALMYSM